MYEKVKSMSKLYTPYIYDDWQQYRLKNPIFNLLGLRTVISGHTPKEELVLQKYVTRRESIVEIGVAEGASALGLRRFASPNATLHLIDPFLPSGKFPFINLTKLVAKRHVNSFKGGKVKWHYDYSFNVSKHWNKSIDFLFIDGDHSYEGCHRDWREWSPYVIQGGIVAFHDGRMFEGGWTTENTGSVKVVNQLFRNIDRKDWKIIDEVDSIVVVQRSI